MVTFRTIDPEQYKILHRLHRVHRHSFRPISGMRWENDEIVVGDPQEDGSIDSVWFCDACHAAASLRQLMVEVLFSRRNPRISMVEPGVKSILSVVEEEEAEDAESDPAPLRAVS